MLIILCLAVIVLAVCAWLSVRSVNRMRKTASDICHMADSLTMDMDDFCDDLIELKSLVSKLSDVLYSGEEEIEGDIEETVEVNE